VATPASATAQETVPPAIDGASVTEGYSLNAAAANPNSRSAHTNDRSGFHHQSQPRPQIWISDIGTLLFDDLDGDGYHSGFSVTIDVDSEFGDTEVYAKIYLEPSDSPSVLMHTTSHFSVYGTSVGDEYRVDTELRNNFVADHYSVAIDIHDAWSDKLLATANERGFSNLRQLPLESSDMTQYDHNPDQHDSDQHVSDSDHEHDDHQHDNDHQTDQDSSADVVVTEYAGLFHPALLLLLAGGLLIRRRNR